MAVPLEVELARIGVSLFLGGALGLEREIRGSPAGLRTVMLVTLGATLFTLASLQLVAPGVDMSRIASHIVVGIGFIGAGVIFQFKDRVHGLTTAASLWTAAAIGLMVGIGEFSVAIATTAVIILILWFGKWEKKVLH